MASVELSGNQLVVVCRGTRRSTGVSIDPARPDQVEAAVRRAISAASPFFWGQGDAQGKEVDSINASAAAAAIRNRIAPKPAAAAPEPANEKAAAPKPQSAPKRQAAAPAAAPPAPKQERAEAAQARAEPGPKGKTAESKPRPEISLEWVDNQLRDAKRDDKKAQAAAGMLHANSRFVERFLDPGLQRGLLRTDPQKSATISLFNALYQIPGFRLYLSSTVAQQTAMPKQDRVYPEFIALQEFLIKPEQGEQLGPQTEAKIIAAADLYIRYFLLDFVCGNADFAKYRDEVMQLPTTEWRLRNVEGARSFRPAAGRQPSDLDRAALLRLYISSPMDADTLTAGALFLRRWYLENPEKGSGRSQAKIASWKAPEVIAPDEETARAFMPEEIRIRPAAARVGGARPAKGAGEVPKDTPRVVIIGDSLVASGRIGATLRTSLRTTWPQASVESRGASGESIDRIRSRFEHDVLAARPLPTTVVIEGGVNGIMGIKVSEAQMHFTSMINEARKRNIKVVLVGIPPWAGYSTSSNPAQQRTTELNAWLRDQAKADGTVVFVDIASQLGEGRPPRLKAAYEREAEPDHLHPGDAGSDLIARMIGEAAFARAPPTKTEAKTALEIFAEKNWKSLTQDLYNAGAAGNPAAIVSISRALPSGEASLEGALKTLGREDIGRAMDRLFNEYLRHESGFMEFCRADRAYQGVAMENVTLGPERTPAERRLIMRAVQAYINHKAAQGEEWCSRLREDIRFLQKDVLKIQRNALDVNGQEDVRMLAAIAVFSWRSTHRSDAVGAWASPLGIRPPAQPARQQEAQPVAPPPRPVQEAPKRRVIHP